MHACPRRVREEDRDVSSRVDHPAHGPPSDPAQAANAAVGDKALADLVAVVDQVSGKSKRATMEDAYDEIVHALWRSKHYHRCLDRTPTYR
jgi:hypothetical protein